MFNVTVINLKQSIRRIAILIVALIIVLMITRLIPKIKANESLKIDISEKIIECLDEEIPAIENTYYKSNETIKEDGEEEHIEESMIAKILGMELTKAEEKTLLSKDENTKQEEQPQEQKNEENQLTTEEVPTNANTEIVTQNLIAESYNTEIGGVKIKNETSFEVNASILEKQLDINKKNVIIFHTHTCESYTPSELYPYQQTGNFRTTDLNYSVSRVGDELANYLIGSGFNVLHDKTYHDYPAYTGSYTRSCASVENDLKTNPSDIIIDLHRDAIGSKSNYDPSVRIGEDVAAQLMFVIGTNGGGLYHPNWQSNLKFAIDVQQKANEMYPGLFKPMIVRNSRYNQHLGKAATIIEVGATGNTLEQCLTSMKYLAKILEEL